ncbi:hypothetical protein HK102_000340 [Quaeritorhiza haematococci]|nr:hypothetical protein HK102_000340 [Quaeritorhiza haematococci]
MVYGGMSGPPPPPPSSSSSQRVGRPISPGRGGGAGGPSSSYAPPQRGSAEYQPHSSSHHREERRSSRSPSSSRRRSLSPRGGGPPAGSSSYSRRSPSPPYGSGGRREGYGYPGPSSGPGPWGPPGGGYGGGYGHPPPPPPPPHGHPPGPPPPMYWGPHGGRGRSPPRQRRYEVVKGSDNERKSTSCLYIGNLPYGFRESDVTEVFERYGRVKAVSVPFDRFTGRNKGFAFVQYEDRRDAEDAMAKYDGTLVGGRRLKLDWDIGLDKKDDYRGGKRSGHTGFGDPAMPPPRQGYGGPPGRNGYGGDGRGDGGRGDYDRGRRSPRYSPYEGRERRRSPSPYSRR